ncbi:MAG: ornithine cyclodeaminase family protein [Gammaproteobacteria bacterium]|nr:ornithine cyclodeaminase family protein [Gammaproteobacteria bacterium]
MRFFDSSQVHGALPYASLVPALIDAHHRDVDLSQSLLQTQPSAGGGEDIFLSLPAWQRGHAMGAKLVTVFPHNEFNGSGLPSVQAVFVLFDGANGKPRAVVDGTALTLRKTASDSAAGSHFLAREDCKSLLVVGAGALAPHLAMAHLAVRPAIRRVAVWNRTASRAASMVRDLDLPGVELTTVRDLEAATREADLITCATMATEPLILGKWLKPGTHLDLVGSFRTDMHECDGEAISRSSVFVDSPWSALEDSGELITAFSEGTLSREDIQADLFDLARGKHPGRRSGREITVYKNGGGGHLDLMVAGILLAEDSSGPAG